MTLVVSLLAPLLLAIPALGGSGYGYVPAKAEFADAAMELRDFGLVSAYDAIFTGDLEDSAAQVRIEQGIIIRIPLGPAFQSDPDLAEPRADRLIERKTGDCVPAGAIAEMIPDADRRLILIMRDSTLLGLTLERGCRPRDFYSGFYYARQPDGKLCVGRDMLLSRSGASCKLTRLRRLVSVHRKGRR